MTSAFEELYDRVEKLESTFEKRFKDLDFAYSALWNNLEDRIKKQELKLGALITMAEENSHLKVPCKKQTLNEYLEDLIR